MLIRSIVLSAAGQGGRVARLLEGPLVDVEERAARDTDWPRLREENLDLLVLDAETRPGEALAVLEKLSSHPDRPELIVLRDREDAAERAELLAAGCLAVLNRGLADQPLRDALQALVLRRSAPRRPQLDEPGGVRPVSAWRSCNPRMQQLLRQAQRVALADSPVLLLGETGVGKEWLARAIHLESRRQRGPFVAVNCAALPEQLLESELFGHERGAFTGATRARRGHFELAQAAPCCSTRSATCRRHSRRSSCGRCRTAGSSGSAANGRSPSTSES